MPPVFDEIVNSTMLITEPSFHENLALEEILNSTFSPNSPKKSESQENLNFLAQLTKITNQEYVGKEICTVCLKNLT